MKRIWFSGFLVVGCLVFGFLYFIKDKNGVTVAPNIIQEKIPTPTPSPTPVPINKDTNLSELLDQTTPAGYEQDFKNLTQDVK